MTELNAGRKTAGVDGKVVVTAPGKAVLADRVRQSRHNVGRAQPVKRVYIPKANGKQTPARDSRDLRPRAPSPAWSTHWNPSGRPGSSRSPMDFARPWLPRRHRGHLQRGEGSQPEPPVGASTPTWRRRSTGSTIPTSRSARHVSRQGAGRAVVEGRRGRAGSVRPDRGGNSSGRGDQPRAVERRACTGWNRPPGSATNSTAFTPARRCRAPRC